MTAFWLLVCLAFEFCLPRSSSSALLAGAACQDWRAGFDLNPALVVEHAGTGFGAAYSRPYGLAGVDWFGGCVAYGRSRWAAGLGVSTLGCEGYRESGFGACGACRLPGQLALGARVEWLVLDQGRYGADGVAAFGMGASWQTGRMRLGLSGERINRPRFDNGTLVDYRLSAGAAFNPTDDLLLLLDVTRDGPDNSLAGGVEFKLIPQMALRGGVGYEPLAYAAGLGVTVRPVQFDYAYRFHPQLKDTHVFSITASWH